MSAPAPLRPGGDDAVRPFGVEEELLLVDEHTLYPLPVGEWVVDLDRQSARSGHQITPELKQEQIEVVSPPQSTLIDQLEAIRAGRALAATAAARVGGRVVALPTAPGAVRPHLVSKPRYERIRDRFGLTAIEQLTCGFHVHVQINSREEGVAVIDRIRRWLPALLALSANSPFWAGTDTGFASYRYQLWNRWPTAGPTDVFGSIDAYDRLRASLLGTGVPLDPGMLYFDARLCEHHPTVEVRIADVCLEAEHAAVIAAIVRALVETAARAWRGGVEPDQTPASVLRAWSWDASFHGVESQLIDPSTSVPVPAEDVIAGLLGHVRPVLAEYGEEAAVESVLVDILRAGSGARRQREAYAEHRDFHDVVAVALEATHHDGPDRWKGLPPTLQGQEN